MQTQQGVTWVEIARIDQAYGLGVDDATRAVGSRRLVAALLEQLKPHRKPLDTPLELRLRAKLGVCQVPHEIPFISLDLELPLGIDKAGHRLGLREMVAQLRGCLEAHTAEEGNQELSLDAHTVIEMRVLGGPQ